MALRLFVPISLLAVALAHAQTSSSGSSASSSSSFSAAENGGGLLSEARLYGPEGSMDKFSHGYGENSDKTERIDQPIQQLPTIEETQEGKEQFIEHQFPDEHRDGKVNLYKEINSYTIQKKILNIKNRVTHRYLKNLFVNTIYNTQVRRIQHQKLVNLLINTLQEVHQPKLLVKYSRNDNVQNGADVNEKPEVSEEKQDKVLPPIFLPAVAEKVGYDGTTLKRATRSLAGSKSAAELRYRSGRWLK